MRKTPRHPVRSARKRNAARRLKCATRQRVLSPDDQQKRRDWKAALQAKRYPVPPLYRYSYEDAPPTQPACYSFQLQR